MLHSIRIVNGIKHKDKTFYFNEGLTIIKGKNGNGKSLIQEFIRFAMFGTSALRGKLSDYDADFKVILNLTIKDSNIVIHRKLKDCRIICGDEEIQGTTPCNAWIINKLGYDLSVFDMGNAAKQMEINKLGKMKPTERKNAIDQIIGLTAVTKLIKSLKEEKSELNSYIKGFETALIEPEEPQKPINYKESEEIHKDYLEKINIKDKITDLLRKVEESKCEEVTEWKGDIPQGDLSKESLFKHYSDKLKSFPDDAKEGSKYTEKELLDWFGASLDWRDWTEPELTTEEANKYLSQWVDYRGWLSAHRVKCPKCGTEITLGYTEEVSKPEFSEEYLQEQYLLNVKKPQKPRPEVLIDEKFFNSERNKVELKKRYDEYLSKVIELGKTDYEALKKYNEYKVKYDNFVKYKNYKEELDTYKDIDVDNLEKECSELWENYTTARIYESKVVEYKHQKSRYDNTVKLISEKKDRVEKIEKGIIGLTNFMSMVKNSIIPSLSKVSSELVSEMSNGSINTIKIDDDFTITADDKEICLLSGGEEAVVNLAIRLALSSVLTRKAFNVFIGDEIDQSMDEERASKTSEILWNLTSQVKQIILITHKNVMGDNIIEVS